jgi:hypothetical protein|tara:strand:+ start:42668 stop:42823 length:156 start_codon:yes stop_codon:yes gene_type:complete
MGDPNVTSNEHGTVDIDAARISYSTTWAVSTARSITNAKLWSAFVLEYRKG